VAIRPRILETVTMARAVDGADDVTDEEQLSDQSGDIDTTHCDCAELSDDFPCWECVRTGRRDLPE
jgi:hypothetical protein